jgi:hypothetical protein
MTARSRWRAFGLGLVAGCGGTAPTPPPAAAPPPTGWIYYAETRVVWPSQVLIWRIRPDGSDRMLVPNPDQRSAGPEFDVSWDGRWLAFNRVSQVLMVPVATPQQAYLLTERGMLGQPLLDPLATVVVRARSIIATGRTQLLLTPVAGGPDEILVESTEGIWPVMWFAGADSLVYGETGGKGMQVYNRRTRTTHPLSPHLAYFKPTPSGRRGITWEADPVEYETKNHWRMVDLATGTVLARATHPYGAGQPAWSPDERYFATICQTVAPGSTYVGLCVYDTTTLQPVRRLVDPSSANTYLDYVRWIP